MIASGESGERETVSRQQRFELIFFWLQAMERSLGGELKGDS